MTAAPALTSPRLWGTALFVLLLGCGDPKAPLFPPDGAPRSDGPSLADGPAAGDLSAAGPLLQRIDPTSRGGGSFVLTAFGLRFAADCRLRVGQTDRPTTFVSAQKLTAQLSAMTPGTYPVRALCQSGASNAKTLTITDSPPVITLPAAPTVAEEKTLTLSVSATDSDGDAVRLFAPALPPGARFDEAKKTLTFRPDFIQGGRSYRAEFVARSGTKSVTKTLTITVTNTIKPPWPAVKSRSSQIDHERLVLAQKTDTWLDSPGHAGRSFEARVTIPTKATAAAPLPVRVYLHGFGGSPYTGGDGEQFRIYPHDPNNTYWWGYSEKLPGGTPTSGTVPNYTQRRVLHLLEWVLTHYPGADPNRVYVSGGSMGGAGAAQLGLLYARHFFQVNATIGQTIARNHRPSRIKQLATLWGDPGKNLSDGSGMGVWDRLDLTRALRDSPEARNQFIYTKHGKDDPTIHFGAVVQKSAKTGLSFYQALQRLRVGHYVVWDEGGHGSADPVLGSSWWDSGWSRLWTADAYLRRDRAFVAFSGSSADRDPGTGGGNGKQSWSDSSGYAGTVSVAGDTGWDGQIAGARNRSLRWDARQLKDTVDRFELPLRVLDGSGAAPPKSGYPTTKDKFDGTLPVIVDVTPRRVSGFVCRPGETVRYTFGSQSGTVKADSSGAVTVPKLKLTKSWQTLTLRRQN